MQSLQNHLGMTAEHAARVQYAFQELERIKVGWQSLANDYASLPLVIRRDMRLGYSRERFYLAAVLQHQVNKSDWSHTKTMESIGFCGIWQENVPGLPTEKYCPVSRSWYSEVVEAEQSMGALHDPRYTAFALPRVEWLLHCAKQILRSTEILYNLVTMSVPEGWDSVSDVGMMRAWNGICSNTGVTFDGALDIARARHNTPHPNEPRASDSGMRFWFLYEVPKPSPMTNHPSPPPRARAQPNPFAGQHNWMNVIPNPPQSSCAGSSSQRPHRTQTYQQLPSSFPQQGQTQQQGGASRQGGFGQQGCRGSHNSHQRQQGGRFGIIGTRTNNHRVIGRPSPARLASDVLNRYNETWDAVQAHDARIPYPSSSMHSQDLQNRQITTRNSSHQRQWPEDTIIKVNAILIFAKAVGLFEKTDVDSTGGVWFAADADDRAVRRLKQQLRQERLHFHPDQLNRRIGRSGGGVDETISQRAENKGVWAAIEELGELCNEFLGQT